MLAEAEAELAATETAAKHLRQVVDGLSGLLSGVEPPANVLEAVSLNPDTRSAGGSKTLRPVEAVRRTLEAHPNQAMDFKAIWSYINEQSWDDPSYKAYRNASDAAARRLSASGGEFQRLGDGSYLYTVDAAKPPFERPVDGRNAGPTERATPEFLTSTEAGPTASMEALT